MSNWNTPNNSEPAHENVLKALADKDTYSLTMGQAGGVWTNQPVGAMLWNNSAAYFQRWDGSNAIPVVISVAGGGTGGSTPEQARANLGANDAGNLTTGVLPAARLVGAYNISISGNAEELQGNNAAFYRNASNLNAGTVPAARLPLNDTVTSTSTAQAATANAARIAYNKGVEGLNRASTQVGGGAISGVYYNETSVNMSGKGDFTGGILYIVRVGKIVTLSADSLSHPSLQFAIGSSSPVPSWARPSGNREVVTSLPTNLAPGVEFRVASNGNIQLSYRNADGALANRTGASELTLTYSV